MYIKALVVLLPLLLHSVSSLVIPPAEESRACQESEINSKWGNFPVHCGPHKVEQHIKPIKPEAIKEDSEIGIEYHTLNARKPVKKNSNKNTDKKTSKPVDQKTTSGETQPKSDSSKSGTEGPLTRGRKKTQAAEQSPPAEDKKSQSQPSGTKTESQPGSSTEKNEDKQKEEAKQSQTGDQTLTQRPKEEPKSSETKPQPSDSQNEPAKPSDQEANKNSGAGGKPSTQEDKGKGKATDNGDGDKKDDPNGDKKDYSDTMYHVVTPDPNTKKGEEDLNGERSYYRKIGDGNPNAPGRYSTHLPSFSGVQSHGQEPGVSQKKAKETDQEARKRPGEREEEATTGHDKVNAQGQPLTEWHKITPKPQDQLEKDQKAWTDEDLRQNLLKQQKEFPDHKAGETDDEYGKLTQEMLKMCNHEQCTKQQFPDKLRRAIIDQPLLHRRLENLLQERDHLVTLALR